MESNPTIPSWRRALPRIGLDEASELPARRLAELLTFAGERGAAADAYRELIEGSPEDLEVLEKLASVLGRLGRVEEELAIHRRIAAIVSDKLGVAPEHREAVIAFEMAARGVTEAPAAAPAAFVAASFDAYAENFEEELRTSLHYRGPEQILERMERVFGAGAGALDVCDAGCGTGVLGPLLRPFARSLQGVDLSPRMLDKARERGVYDQLVTADLAEHLGRCPAAFDVITAADVFVYIGDLGPVLAAVRGALREGGCFFFTVERADGDGYELHLDGRYAHAERYLRAAAEAAGLAVLSLEEEVLRRERGLPVRALIGAFGRPSP
jgi:predicted TPR repeat methyltransferase